MAARPVDPVRLSIAFAASGMTRGALARAAGCGPRTLQAIAAGELLLSDRVAAGLASVVGEDAVRYVVGEVDCVVVVSDGRGGYRVQAPTSCAVRGARPRAAARSAA